MVSSRHRIASALCLLVGAGIFVSFKMWARFETGDPKTLVQIGQPLPGLSVEMSGAAVDLKAVTTGRRSVIVFYSPSCQTCRSELPSLKPFPASIRLVMVSESKSGEHEGLKFSEALQCYDRWGMLPRSFVMAALPTIIFVDEDGIVRDGLAGSPAPGLLQRKLQEFASRRY